MGAGVGFGGSGGLGSGTSSLTKLHDSLGSSTVSSTTTRPCSNGRTTPPQVAACSTQSPSSSDTVPCSWITYRPRASWLVESPCASAGSPGPVVVAVLTYCVPG